MKSVGFGDKRIYVMTKEEHDKLEALIGSIYADSMIVHNYVRLDIAESNVSDVIKQAMMDTTKDLYNNMQTVFRAI